MNIASQFLMAIPEEAISSLFFPERYRNDRFWNCASCGAIVSQHNGFSNSCNHVSSKHINEIMERHQARWKRSRETFGSSLFNRETLAIRTWIKYLVFGFQPFCFVENENFYHHFKHEIIYRKTLIVYLRKLISHVESKIKIALADQIAIAFGGWSLGLTHFVGIFATYPSNRHSGLWSGTSRILSLRVWRVTRRSVRCGIFRVCFTALL